MRSTDIVKLLCDYENDIDMKVWVNVRLPRAKSESFMTRVNWITPLVGGFSFRSYSLVGNPSITVHKDVTYTARQIKSIAICG